MAAGLDTRRLGLVFQSRPDILEGIRAAADSPARVKLFNNIANFVHDQLQSGSEPAAKRRRVDDDRPANGTFSSVSNGDALNGADPSKEQVLLEVKEISVSVPQRKKFDLCFTAHHLYARAPGSTTPAPGIVYAWKDIEYAFYLPVPEKAQVQHNYILFPRGTCITALKSGAANPPATSPAEPLVFTVPATAPKQGTITGPDAAKASAFSDAYQTLFHWALKAHLRSAGNPLDITSADPNRFHSVVPQSHRPKEKAVHVKAFRGSKDGYLFFLQNGVLWGYKKPLMFIPLDRIAAVSYTSVLQRTFNMVIEVFVPGEEQGGESTEEVEFAMIDQADFGGIDEAYVKKNRLQDRSMAETRKAKLELAENAKAGKKAGAGEDPEGGDDGPAAKAADEGDGMTELERAQLEAEQKLQDEEDEDEEDYDPGSDADSDGSGSSDDDSDDDDDEDDEEDGEGGEGEEGGEGGGEEEDDDEAEGEEEEEQVQEELPQAVAKEQKKPKSATLAGLLIEDEDRYDEMEVEEDETFDVVG